MGTRIITAIAAAFSLRIVYPFAVHFRRNLHFAVIKFACNHWNNLLTAQDIEYIVVFIRLMAFNQAAVYFLVEACVIDECIARMVVVAVFFLKAAVEPLIFFNLPPDSIRVIKLLHPPLVGNIFFIRQFVIRHHQAGNITVRTQAVLIPGVARGTLPHQFDIAPFKVLIAHACLYVQAGSRFPVEDQVRAPFALFRRLRAAQGRHAGQYAERVHQVGAVSDVGAFFQRFALVVGGKGEAEFVGKAEAVAEVEAVADDVGTLPCAGNDDAVRMFDVVAFLIQLLLQLR